MKSARRRGASDYLLELCSIFAAIAPALVSILTAACVLGALAAVLLLAAPSKAHAQVPAGVVWDCGFKGTRTDNVGTSIWAYCFGELDGQVYVRKRVIMPSAITAESKAEVRQWVLTGTPDLWARATSTEVWNSPQAQQVRTAMEAAIERERIAGTLPKPRVWKVAPNPSSTSTPPTRPMWDPAGTKQVAERATVGALCDCSTKVAKSTQTLCPLSPFTEPGANLPDLPPAELAALLAKRNLTACVLVPQ